MSKLVEKRNELEAKQKQLAAIFEEAGPEIDLNKVKSVPGDVQAKLAEIQRMNKELSALGAEVEQLAEMERIAKSVKGFGGFKQPSGDSEQDEKNSRREEVKDLGSLFIKSEFYKSRKKNAPELFDVELKTLMSTTAGFAPQSIRSGLIVPAATRPVQVLDLIPFGNVDQASLVYMEETTFTNNAAETAEAGTYPEAAIAFTERTSPVRKVAVFLPVTDEQLEDVAFIESWINQRLTFMLRQRLDSQVLVGNGTAPNLTGILNVSGIQTQAKGADPSPDAIYKAMTNVRVTGRAIPNAVIVHPTNWQAIRTLRDANGNYVWGHPAEQGVDRIWGLPVAQSDAITLGTALVGDFVNFSGLFEKRGIEVQVSNSHSTYFVEGKQAIRADMRVAFATTRPAAFCTVTGL